MLLEAIELQKNAVNELLSQIDGKEELTFKAPTGSGKTYMMADFMNQMLEENEDIIFLVSTLSKGNLAKQNYEKFLEYSSNGSFKNLNPYLINTEIVGEEILHVPTEYNVYLLPRDLYKAGGRLMQGTMDNFLFAITANPAFGGLDKKIILIKDECHIATNNLDNLAPVYFEKIVNFSATPNLRRGQHPDVEIKDEDAVAANLIKHIELGEETDSIGDALNKFEEIKDAYRNLLGVNPCLIIQISNKDKAEDELNNEIFPELNKAEHQDLKWMLIMDKDSSCDTNDVFKAKKMPVNKWKDYAKLNSSTIDVIIFKMMISEGWDIPRACMLYQKRDTQSKQLDEQVMGRVRRNPRLLDFENLSDEAKKLATTAWIWGVIPEDKRKVFGVKLFDEVKDIQNEFKIKTTKIKKLTNKVDFDINEFISSQPEIGRYSNIFDLYKKINKQDHEVKQMCYEYANSYDKWWEFAEHIDKIAQESSKFSCDYEESMCLTTDENGKVVDSTFSPSSSYTDNGNYVNISDWVWKRRDGKDKFSFDSDAEREWATILKDLSSIDIGEGQRVIKKIICGKDNPNAGLINLFNEVEPDKLDETTNFLWGKNYLTDSDIKFEYYLNGIHSSYPDFVLKDGYDRIHLFEVKSVNISNATGASFDSTEYKLKVEALKKCYKQASKLTNQIFYLPVLKDDTWHITQLINGEEVTLSKSQFIDFIKTN